jgi:hypothetical protein
VEDLIDDMNISELRNEKQDYATFGVIIIVVAPAIIECYWNINIVSYIPILII